ncbi:MAG: response regulator transcription factor [Alphaproteobacteria bacterium]|nr:response regulator transcription factor [Alphaproteobacteria bacterium]
MSAGRILLVDDDPSLREVARYALDRAGFEVIEAGDGRSALDRFARHSIDLVVLDVLMPEVDGLEVCRTLRATSQVPVVFLSSRGEEVDRILGLELGGDDYLTKPFSPRELVSRVKAVLRRTRPEARSTTVEAVGVRLDVEAFRAWAAETEIQLTVTEFRLLEVMLRRPGRVFTRDELVERAYEGPHHVSDRTLDSHIRRIRQKLREGGLDPIETVHGLGFRFEDRRT